EIHEALEDVQELADIIEMQAGGGLIENVDGSAGLALGELAGQLDALGFAAGKRGGRLAELHVAETHFDHGGKLLLNLGNVFENLEGIAGRQIQNIVDAVPLVANSKRFRIVAAAATNFAGDIHVREKIHFDAAEAFSLAGFATPAFHVEAEAPGAVTALAGFREHGKELANGGEDAGVGGGIRARRAANGRLIDLDDFVDVLDSKKHTVRAGRLHGAIELLRQDAVENVVDQRGFSGPGDAGDNGEQAQRKGDIEILQVVGVRPEHLNHFSIGAAALGWNGNLRRTG